MLVLGACLVVAFFLLVAERQLAARKAAGAQALARLALLACLAFAGLNLADSYRAPYVATAKAAISFVLAAVLAEILCRALWRLCVRTRTNEAPEKYSVLATVLTAPFTKGGLKTAIHHETGLDFSRSFAFAYLRAAALPMAAALLLLAWALTGVAIVPMGERAIYERFGAPAAVLHPGPHLILPWPAGKQRKQDFGEIQNIGLVPASTQAQAENTAEGDPPKTANRLWTAPHPGEITLAVASESRGRQNFQSVSADLRLLYRVGLSDAQAIDATYSTENPQILVRAIAGQVVTSAVAGRTLADMLGAHREKLADIVRAKIQAELDRLRTGIEMVAVVIEAIQPPAGAADAYHAVRAAEIAAQASIAAERGNAAIIRAQSRQYATDKIDAASATAAEIFEAARAADLRFSADREAAREGQKSFLLERYFGNLSTALAAAPKTIIDHRLNWPEAPVLDLRPPQAAGPTTEKGD